MKQLFIIAMTTFFLIESTKTMAQQPPDFNAEKAAGIFTYDIDKVIKKLKVEDNLTKNSITKSLHDYNVMMDQLAADHNTTFQALDARFDQQVKIAMQRRDRSEMDGVKQEIRETIPPIRKQVMEHEQTLNASMDAVLNEKQYKKWLSYQKSKRPSSPIMSQ